MKKFVLSLLAATSLISLNAFADKQFVGADKFYDLIQEYKEVCGVAECVKPYREMSIYQDGVRSIFLSEVQFKKLNQIAHKQSYIWMDTVLQGDLHSDGQTVLEEVVAIFRSNTLVAYKIDYSEKAWYVGACKWDGENESTLRGCPEGKIHESSFVSPDFKTFIRNTDDIAKFYN
ncbi:hypothetical protein EZJ49_04375 [Bdellovibrio bacteriovorus]|uniref:hypothetical protein n=1 Tax=Bdellovibrio bacteriovorus TaxID=959 RepID=UPI0021D07F38|nr:hypothetical protein [Bdellovibrio bacteriovorus]UXR65488.1 hypothetical protein EZJ49_04375 [Bdellovibrio bacteriovorus]